MEEREYERQEREYADPIGYESEFARALDEAFGKLDSGPVSAPDSLFAAQAEHLAEDFDTVRETLAKAPLTGNMHTVVAGALTVLALIFEASAPESNPLVQALAVRKYDVITNMLRQVIPGDGLADQAQSVKALSAVFNAVAFGIMTDRTTGFALPPM